MSKKQKPKNSLENLTWNDLEAWAGSRIVSRGKSYRKNGHVRELAQTSEGRLIAYVRGSERYVTQVASDSGNLSSECTCPYGSTCKHAVAVVLEYLEQIRQGKEIVRASDDDPRFAMLEAEDEDDYDGYDDDFYDDDEDDDNFHPEYEVRKKKPASESSLKAFLESKTKSQLVDLIIELARHSDATEESLRNRIHVADGSVQAIVKAIRKDIREFSREPYDYDDYGSFPNYSRTKERLETLLSGGYYDEILSVGKDLLKAGTEQVEMYNDEGELGEEIGGCMDIVFRALPRTSLSPVEQMVWATDTELADQYDLCSDTRHFWNGNHSRNDWSGLADILLARLPEQKVKKGRYDFSAAYQRDSISSRAIRALEEAGRGDEILPLCRKEAEVTGSYVRLVKYLLKNNQPEEAEEWIAKGIQATDSQWPGISAELRKHLEEIRKVQGDWPGITVMRAGEFFRNPCLETWKETEEAAKKAGVWESVRTCALNYLETGSLPNSKTGWPLSEIGPVPPSRFPETFPDINVLIQIAVYEKNPDEVLKWYEIQKKERGGYFPVACNRETVAEALKEKYPDHSLEIWKHIVEKSIAEVKPSGYQTAAKYLAKICQVMSSQGKEKAWQKYLSDLKQTHARKKRLMEILDGVSGKRILDI